MDQTPFIPGQVEPRPDTAQAPVQSQPLRASEFIANVERAVAAAVARSRGSDCRGMTPLAGYLSVSVSPEHDRLTLEVILGGQRLALCMAEDVAAKVAGALTWPGMYRLGWLPCTKDGAIRWRVDGDVQIVGAELQHADERGSGSAVEVRAAGFEGALIDARLNAAFETFGDLHPRDGRAPEEYGFAPSSLGAVAEFEERAARAALEFQRRAARDSHQSPSGSSPDAEGVLEAPPVKVCCEGGAVGGEGVPAPHTADIESAGDNAGTERRAVVDDGRLVGGDRDGRVGAKTDRGHLPPTVGESGRLGNDGGAA